MSAHHGPRWIEYVLLLVSISGLVLVGLALLFRNPPAPVVAPTPMPVPTSPAPTPAPPLERYVPSPATKTAGCVYHTGRDGARLPDPACTPGGTNPALTVGVLCAPRFSTAPYRDVSVARKAATYQRYGVREHVTGQWEVDHVVPIETGGSNDDANLYPQPASPRPGFHDKDRVENWLHGRVCSGAVSLAVAQQSIASDWSVLFDQMRAADPNSTAGPDPDDNGEVE